MKKLAQKNDKLELLWDKILRCKYKNELIEGRFKDRKKEIQGKREDRRQKEAQEAKHKT